MESKTNTSSFGKTFGNESANSVSEFNFSNTNDPKLQNANPNRFNNKADSSTEHKTTSFLFGGSAKPAFSFGANVSDNKSNGSGEAKGESASFNFGNTAPAISDSKVHHLNGNKLKENKNKKTGNAEKPTKTSREGELPRGDQKSPEGNQLLESYVVPPMNDLTNHNQMEISDEEAFYDVDIDENTNLPIRRINYSESKSPLLSNEHLKFAISSRDDKGVVYVAPSNKDIEDKEKTKLFPFDLLPQLDKSFEYRDFLNSTYKDFEQLLKDKKYEHFLSEEEEDFVGVPSVLKKQMEDRQMVLKEIMSSLLMNMQLLIKNKIKKDFVNLEDQWVLNYEEIINVLYLLNALHFGNKDETTVLFQQWIERIDIQPTEELVETVFKESDKPYENPLFWSNYVKKLLMRGSFSNLVDDFKVSMYEELKDSDNELFEIIDEFVNLISLYDPIKFSYDMKAFLHWKQLAVALRENSVNVETNHAIIQAELLELLSIISGSSKTINECSASWYECFIGHFLYQMPSKQLIPKYIDNALDVETYPKPIPGVEAWDSICVDLLKNKFLSVIASIEALDKSIGTFVAILIEAAGLLSTYSEEIGKDDAISKKQTNNSISASIDRMVEDLALTYLSNQELFPIGVGILINTGNSKSREILSEVLPTYEIKDSDDFEWVLSVCSQLKLSKTMATIQQIQGEKFFEKHLIPNALSCFAASHTSEKVVSTVWRLFEDTLIRGELDEELAVQLFESDFAKNNGLLRQCLSPLYVLNEIMKPGGLHNRTWTSRLLSLFDFRYLPSFYKAGLVVLLFENLNQNVFTLENLALIIEQFNRFESHINADSEAKLKCEALYKLMVENRSTRAYPVTFAQLLHTVRRGIAMDVSFTFLDDTQYQ